MNDVSSASEPTSYEKRKTRRIILGTAVVVVLIGAAAFIASKAGLDKALVRQELDLIAAQLKQRGAAQGREITFTYGAINIEGGISDRHAVVHDVKLQTRPLVQPGVPPKEVEEEASRSLVIASPVLEITPKSPNLAAFEIALPQPLTFTTIEEPEKTLLTITNATPLAVTYASTKKDGDPITHWSFTAPKGTKLTYLREQQAEGVEDETPTIKPVYETLAVDMEKGEGELTLLSDQSGLGQGMLELKAITLTPEAAPEGKVIIDHVVSQWSNQRNAKKLNVVNSSFAIDNVQADPQFLPYAPISAALDVTYEGPMPSTQEEMAAMETQESAFKLKTFSISTRDATVSASADFVANTEDKLPVGIANVTITNLPFIVGELKKYQVMDDSKEQLMAALLQQITGTPYAELKDVVVDVNRARGGSFKVGKSTFEELFAALLSASISQKQKPHPVPAIPQDKKAQEPVALPEETRG